LLFNCQMSQVKNSDQLRQFTDDFMNFRTSRYSTRSQLIGANGLESEQNLFDEHVDHSKESVFLGEWRGNGSGSSARLWTDGRQ